MVLIALFTVLLFILIIAKKPIVKYGYRFEYQNNLFQALGFYVLWIVVLTCILGLNIVGFGLLDIFAHNYLGTNLNNQGIEFIRNILDKGIKLFLPLGLAIIFIHKKNLIKHFVGIILLVLLILVTVERYFILISYGTNIIMQVCPYIITMIIPSILTLFKPRSR